MASDRFEKLNVFIENEIINGVFPGAGVLITQHGTQVHEKYWGTYCSRTHRSVPVDANVSHMLYSFSKGISATILVLAHQKKLIDYDAPLQTYIPEYRGQWKDNTTIRHLLTHSAGIPKFALPGVCSPEEWSQALSTCYSSPVQWEPGSKTEYHGLSGMFLAAEAVRRTLNMATWQEICQEFLFEPLNIKSLTFKVPDSPCVALTPQPKDLPCPIDTTHFRLLGHPGAGCFGRLEDMIKILELHLNQGLYKGQQIIQREEFEEMHSVQYEKQIQAAIQSGSPRMHEPWGLGWLKKRDEENHWFGFGPSPCERSFSHAGIDTVLGLGEPKQQLAFAFVTTNSPQPDHSATCRVRCTVTELIMEAIRA